MKYKKPSYIDLSSNADFIGMVSIKPQMLVSMLKYKNKSIDSEKVYKLGNLYIKWGRKFNIRSDFSWSHMCVQTNFLKSQIAKEEVNNFGGLTYLDEVSLRKTWKYYVFDTQELGVIAHYAHLAWYLFPEHVHDNCSINFDPKHEEVNGNVHFDIGYKLNCLDNRWSSDKNLSRKISRYSNMIYDLIATGRNSDKRVKLVQKLKNRLIDLVDVEVSSEKWEYIAIHHSAGNSGNARIFRDLHRKKELWRDIGYHFVICNGNRGKDGEVQTGRSIEMRGAHVGKEFNGVAIGVCLVGWFDDLIYEHTDEKRKKFENQGYKRPTKNQMDSLVKLVKDLMSEYNISTSNIIGHREVPEFKDKKSCPGYNFNMDEFRSLMSRM